MQIIMYSKNIENVNISLKKTNEIINGKLSQILFLENTISQQSIMTGRPTATKQAADNC